MIFFDLAGPLRLAALTAHSPHWKIVCTLLALVWLVARRWRILRAER